MTESSKINRFPFIVTLVYSRRFLFFNIRWEILYASYA